MNERETMMKNSKVFMLVTGALLLGLAIGGLGVANAWSGFAQSGPGAMTPLAGAPVSTPPRDVVVPPSAVVTMPIPPSFDTTQAPQGPVHHAARHHSAGRHWDRCRHHVQDQSAHRNGMWQSRHQGGRHHAGGWNGCY